MNGTSTKAACRLQTTASQRKQQGRDETAKPVAFPQTKKELDDLLLRYQQLLLSFGRCPQNTIPTPAWRTLTGWAAEWPSRWLCGSPTPTRNVFELCLARGQRLLRPVHPRRGEEVTAEILGALQKLAGRSRGHGFVRTADCRLANVVSVTWTCRLPYRSSTRRATTRKRSREVVLGWNRRQHSCRPLLSGAQGQRRFLRAKAAGLNLPATAGPCEPLCLLLWATITLSKLSPAKSPLVSSELENLPANLRLFTAGARARWKGNVDELKIDVSW